MRSRKRSGNIINVIVLFNNKVTRASFVELFTSQFRRLGLMICAYLSGRFDLPIKIFTFVFSFATRLASITNINGRRQIVFTVGGRSSYKADSTTFFIAFLPKIEVFPARPKPICLAISSGVEVGAFACFFGRGITFIVDGWNIGIYIIYYRGHNCAFSALHKDLVEGMED